MHLPDDGLILVVKEDCETCRMIAPLAADLERRGLLSAVFCQDNPAFPPGLKVADDRALEASWRLNTEIVPTLVRRSGGAETARVEGWHREEWQALTGLNDIGGDLPPRKECAPLWRARLMAQMPAVKTALLVGSYAQGWHLEGAAMKTMTQTVANWRAYAPDYFVIPHPSWRNNGWIRKHPWFEADLLPALRAAVQAALA